VADFSAHLRHWLAVDGINKLWGGWLSANGAPEMVLFPGLIPLVLALLALLLMLVGKSNFMAQPGSGSDLSSVVQDRELASYAIIWIALGFVGSFGVNFFVNRILFDYVPLFRSMRVAARWAMICYVGLALLGGVGAWRLAQLLSGKRERLKLLICIVIVLAILFEQRVTPLPLVRGEPDPDELTLYLKAKNMTGGIVELPAGETSHRYMLRAADHGRPLVTAIDSFISPTEREIEELTASEHISDRLLDLFETIPASYVTVHNSFLAPEKRQALEVFLDRGIAAGRL